MGDEERGKYEARIAELEAACRAALSLLENIGTGKWANTPAGEKLRSALKIDDHAASER